MKRITTFSLFIFLFTFFSNYSSGQNMTVSCMKNTGGTLPDSGYDIVLDSEKNIYMVSQFQDICVYEDSTFTSFGSTDIVIAKFDSLRNFLWAQQCGGSGTDIAYSLFIDNSDNIFMTGSFSNSAYFGDSTLNSEGGLDIFIVKYDSNGDILLIANEGGASNEEGECITVDSKGNIYLTGYFYNSSSIGDSTFTSTGDADIFIAKFDSNYTFKWAYNCGGTNWDIGRSITTDKFYNVYVAGHYRFTGNFIDTAITSPGACNIFVLSLDSAGNRRWIQNAGGSSSDRAYAITSDPLDNIYVSGYFNATANFSDTILYSTGNRDIFVTKYNSSGVEQWVQQGGSSGEDFANCISSDQDGNVYVTGYFNSTAYFNDSAITTYGNRDIFVAKYDLNGTISYLNGFGGILLDAGEGVAAVDDAIFLTGSFQDTAYFDYDTLASNGNLDIFRLCIEKDTPVFHQENIAEMMDINIYPNPNNGVFTIENNYYTKVDYTMYSFNGRIVKAGSIQNNDKLKVNLSKETKGIYFIKINHDSNQLIKKIILL